MVHVFKTFTIWKLLKAKLIYYHVSVLVIIGSHIIVINIAKLLQVLMQNYKKVFILLKNLHLYVNQDHRKCNYANFGLIILLYKLQCYILYLEIISKNILMFFT